MESNLTSATSGLDRRAPAGNASTVNAPPPFAGLDNFLRRRQPRIALRFIRGYDPAPVPGYSPNRPDV